MVPTAPGRRIAALAATALFLVPLLALGQQKPSEPPGRTALKVRTSDGINLLRLPSAVLEATTAPASERPGLRALTDDDTTTVATATAAPVAPLDIVFGFGGATVTAERLVVALPNEAAPGAAAARVEVLVSTVSPHAGFQSVRVDPLQPQARVQEFAFQPAAARWVLLRFTPAASATRVALAEVAVLGHEGPPASRYAFNESPARALDVLARLKKVSSLNIPVSPDETSLFEDARDGQLDKWSFAEAALMASGVRERERRKTYLARIDALEVEARKAVAGAKTPHEKGEKLLRWLHAGPLAKGYVAGQTDLSGILDTATFNCVSSAVLYNVLGRRLGLDVRAVEVPDHAFAILYDGTRHADVETTNAAGFNPARDKAALEAFQKTTGFTYIPDSHREKRREIREPGLVAIIYYNHGVELTRDKRYHEALLAYFRAMSLDPEFASAVKNTLAVLANWSGELARAGKFDEALHVLATGLELAPRDATLVYNRKAVWGQWADAAMKAGRDDEALTVLKKAADAVPGEAAHFRELQVWVFVRRGEEQIKADDWEKALAVTEPGLQKLDESLRPELRRWRAGVLLRWSQEELKQRRFEQALAALERGMALEPKDGRFTGNLAYVVQEWARDLYARQGTDSARAQLAQLLKRYAARPEARRGAWGYVHGVSDDLCKAGKYDDALAFLDGQRDLLNDKEQMRSAVLGVYSAWTARLRKDGKWEEGLGVSLKALERFPDEGRLKDGLAYHVQQWMKDVHQREGQQKSMALMAALAKKYPRVPELQGGISDHVQRLVRNQRDAGNFAEALETLDRHSGLLADKAKVHDMAVAVYDAWAKRFRDAKDWEGAVAVYVAALERYPKDEHVQHNLSIAVQDGAWDLYQRDGEGRAREFLQRMLERFPDVDKVKDRANNHGLRVVNRLSDAGKWEEALAAVESHKHLLRDEAQASRLLGSVYDRCARQRAAAKDWAGAVDVYARGLRQLGDSFTLRNNLVVTVGEWVQHEHDTAGEERACQVLAEQVQRFSRVQGMRDVPKQHVHQLARKLWKAGKYDEALALVERHREVLRDRAEVESLAAAVYDARAEPFWEKKDWQAAANVYGEGLKRYPGNGHLKDNAVAAYDRWARTFMDKKDWAGAIAVYEKGLKVFPDEYVLKNNLEVCRQRMKQ